VSGVFKQEIFGGRPGRVRVGLSLLVVMQAWAGVVLADAIPVPEVEVDRREIGSGVFRVDFRLAEGVELGPQALFLEVEVIDEQEHWSFASLDSSVWFSSQNPGEMQVRGRVCRSDPEWRDQCGDYSDAARVRIPVVVAVSAPLPEPGEDDGLGIAVLGGASLTHPGSYLSSKTDWNAWQLMWLNSLTHLQAPGSSEPPFFELLVRWLTYEYDTGVGRYIPIWLWAHATQTSSTTFSGALHYRRMVSGVPQDLVIGEVKVTPNTSNRKRVGVQWRSKRGGMYASQGTNTWVSDTLNFADGLAPGTSPAPHDHMMGDWSPLETNGAVDLRASLMMWIERNQESLQLLFFDQAGRPVWARADWHNAHQAPPGTGRTDFCAFTVFDAIAPDTAPSAGHPLTLEWLGNCTQGNGSNVARLYNAVPEGRDRSGRIWANLQLPSYRPGSLQIGTSTSLRNMVKVSHFHDIRPVIDGVDGKATCLVDAGSSCTLDLRWLLEGHYPDAAVYRRTLPSGSPVRIFSNVPGSEPGRVHTLPGSGTYELQIRRTGSSISDLIARSHPVEVQSLQAQQVEFQYDALGRLVGTSGPDGRETVYSYDQAGNRIKITRSGN